MQRYLPLIGRVLLALIFLLSGVGKIGDFAGTQEYMAAAGMPMTALLLVGAIVLEIVGALSIMLGFKAKLGAVALLLFLIPATLIFHTDFADQVQMIMFMKNLSIFGGLLLVVGFGAGPLSLDERAEKRQARPA
ncbi:MAG: DoxX family protein [Bacteroidota bacterium]